MRLQEYDSGGEADPLVIELAELYGVPVRWSAIERAVYKNSDCGPWVRMPADRPLRVEIGCIIEGSDATVGPIAIPWNDGEDFVRRWREAVAYIESEADILWNHEYGR